MKWQYFPNNTNSSPHQPSWSPNLTVNVTLLSFVNAAKCNKCENVRWIISSISGRWSYAGNDRFKNTWYCGYCLSSYHTHLTQPHIDTKNASWKLPIPNTNAKHGSHRTSWQQNWWKLHNITRIKTWLSHCHQLPTGENEVWPETLDLTAFPASI